MEAIICSDFDGTLKSSRGILLSDVEKIRKLRENGVVFVVVTGRSPMLMKEAIVEYNIDFVDFYICCNGSILLDKMFNCISMKPMDLKAVKKMVNMLIQKNVCEEIYLCLEKHDIFIDNIDKINELNDKVLSISLILNQSILFNEIINVVDMEIHQTNPIYVDFTQSNVNKANAILELKHCYPDSFIFLCR